MYTVLATRLKKLQTILTEKKLPTLLISNPTSLYYLTDIQGVEGYILLTHNHTTLITDPRYEGFFSSEKAQHDTTSPFTTRIAKSKVLQEVATVIAEHNLTTIAFEAQHITVDALQRIQKTIPEVTWQGQSSLVERCRRQKSPEEQHRIRQACNILDQGLHFLREYLAPGMTEKEAAWAFEQHVRTAGAEGLAFPTIVASGSNAAIPHHHTGDKKLAEGECILIDAGVRYHGYCSDCTRVLALGKPIPKLATIHTIVQEAQEKAFQALAPNVPVKTVDLAARDHISTAGYGDSFGHSTGHGVGIDIHESPRIHYTAEKDTLLPGDVVTIEPGIYIPNIGGVRIEDTVLITTHGAERLTTTTKTIEP